MVLTRKDWNLLALAAAEGNPLSPVQLQKVLFLLGQEVPDAVEPDFYNFRPYNYGPFDRAVYGDAEALEVEGYAVVAQPPGQRWSEYRATPRGVDEAARLKAEADPRAVAYLERAVEWARGLSFSDLVRAIYAKYPEYRANSVFQG